MLKKIVIKIIGKWEEIGLVKQVWTILVFGLCCFAFGAIAI